MPVPPHPPSGRLRSRASAAAGPARAQASAPGSAPPPARAGEPADGRARALEALVRDLGDALRPAGLPEEALRRLPTGQAALDRALTGGLPRGRLAEVAGRSSSGATSLLRALLATTTHAGEAVAVVDAADAFDPASARAAGIALERVLWVRAPDVPAALRSTERLLEARGFALVLLDLARAGPLRPAGPPVWLRLARRAAASATALVVLTPERLVGPFAALALELAPGRPRFTGPPAWLDGLEARVRLARSRTPHDDTPLVLPLRTDPAAEAR